MDSRINLYLREMMHLKQVITNCNKESLDVKSKSILICLESYQVRLEGFLLAASQKQKLASKAILLRGCIEAFLLVNIFINNDELIARKFYEKGFNDLKYIMSKYKTLSSNEIIYKADRFDYICSNENYPNSLIELVDFATIEQSLKLYFKFFIKYCDESIHPRYNNFKINLDFNQLVLSDYGLISQLQGLILSVLKSFFNIPWDINCEIKINQIITEPENHINEEFLQIKSLIDISNNDVLIALYNDFIDNYFDLEWAIANNRKYLFFIKVRYILEFIALFYLLINNPNIIEIYKLHSTILRKDLLEHYVKNINNPEVKSLEKTYLLNYEQSLNKLKGYYQTKYPHLDLIKIKNNVKQTNGFAIGLLVNKEKAPKTIDLINYTVKQLDKLDLLDFINGLYVESCEYCHISSFAVLYENHNVNHQELILPVKTLLNSLFINIKMLFGE